MTVLERLKENREINFWPLITAFYKFTFNLFKESFNTQLKFS